VVKYLQPLLRRQLYLALIHLKIVRKRRLWADYGTFF
jgi:hypothetical protein